MADWTGTSLSNFVKFKDIEAVRERLADGNGNVEVYEWGANGEHAGKYYLMSTDRNSSWCFVDDEYDDDDEMMEENRRFVVEELCPLLEEGEVLVLMEAGNQALRYVTGYAEAYAWDGRHCRLSLWDIYERAAAAFNVDRRCISHAAC